MVILFTVLGIGSSLIWAVVGWLSQKMDSIWEDQVWDTARRQGRNDADSPTLESTQWLKFLLESVWSLIHPDPDLFLSLADTLGDVMQASLPKLARMIPKRRRSRPRQWI